MTAQGNARMPDPLALSSAWGASPGDQTDIAPLLGLNAVLETSWLRKGISRDHFLTELLTDLHQRRLVPLLAMLPKRWRLGAAALPDHLRKLAELLEGGSVSPLLLAALADDLHHLFPVQDNATGAPADALKRWTATTVQPGPDAADQPLPQSLQAWREQADHGQHEQAHNAAAGGLRQLGADLVWHNHGLQHLQSAASRWGNTLMAQVFNALGANHLPPGVRGTSGRDTPFLFEGVSTTQQLMKLLRTRGWSCRARVRASVASFGLGASCPNTAATTTTWMQVPLAVPYRTGLLDHGEELEALLPHCSLELELTPPDAQAPTLLQYYQGTEGFNGWAAMNDLHRPWQNDRTNGSVAYPGEPIEAAQLDLALDLCDLMAAVHNSAATQGKLRTGGYGALGFCIDSTALVEQALTGRCHLFPLTLGGIWRERLREHLEQLLDQGLRVIDDTSVERYRQALDTLPSDLHLHGNACAGALERLKASQPAHSPFLLVRRLNGEEHRR